MSGASTDPADIAKREMDAAAFRQRVAAKRAFDEAEHERVKRLVSEDLGAVLDLHGPHWSHEYSAYSRCEGCDAEGYDWEHPEWPCRTWTLIAERAS